MVVVASPPSSRSQAVPLQTERGAVGMIYNCSTSLRCEIGRSCRIFVRKRNLTGPE
jgi:hypothetical protein